MNNSFILFVFSILTVGVWNAIEFEQITWLTWQEAQQIENIADKKYLVWIYDAECASCVAEENELFTLANTSYINEHYFSIRLEAHESETIVAKGQAFKNLGPQQHDLHELALALSQSYPDISFPKLVFLDAKMDLIAPVDGNIEALELENLLSFVKDDYFFEMDINQYEESLVLK